MSDVLLAVLFVYLFIHWPVRVLQNLRDTLYWGGCGGICILEGYLHTGSETIQQWLAT